jgi:hypothetical protein
MDGRRAEPRSAAEWRPTHARLSGRSPSCRGSAVTARAHTAGSAPDAEYSSTAAVARRVLNHTRLAGAESVDHLQQLCVVHVVRHAEVVAVPAQRHTAV